MPYAEVVNPLEVKATSARDPETIIIMETLWFGLQGPRKTGLPDLSSQHHRFTIAR